MGSGVLVLDKLGMVALEPAEHDSESDFQELLADHPELLGGDQIDPAIPRKWILVKREKEIADSDSGRRRWSVDHLFLDQDGIPTLVEVKRCSDTRIRREVVGQMLEYSANATAYWDANEIRQMVEKSRGEQDFDLAEAFAIGDLDVELFWKSVVSNLDSGRVRLLFIADRMPDELRRIIEFLNEQMQPAEVLGVEIRLYTNPDRELKAFVPRLIGRTQKAADRKTRTTLPAISVDDLYDSIGEQATIVARHLIDLGRSLLLDIRGTGRSIRAECEIKAPSGGSVTCLLFVIENNGIVRCPPDKLMAKASAIHLEHVISEYKDLVSGLVGEIFFSGGRSSGVLLATLDKHFDEYANILRVTVAKLRADEE